MSLSFHSSPGADAGADDSYFSAPATSAARNDCKGKASPDGTPAPEKLRGPVTPVNREQLENVLEDEERRDSHDLSLNRDTRASVVDNMLLSLDRISPYNAPSPDQLRPALYGGGYQLHAPFSSAPHNGLSGSPRQHRRTYSSSYPSAYELRPSTASSRYSGRHPRSRRSVSSSYFDTDVGRIDSAEDGESSNSPHACRRSASARISVNPRRRGSRKASRASASSSMDFTLCQVEAVSWDNGDQPICLASDDGNNVRHDSGNNVVSDSILSRPRPKGPSPFHSYERPPQRRSRSVSASLQSIPYSTGSPRSKPNVCVPTPPEGDSPRSRRSYIERLEKTTGESIGKDHLGQRGLPLTPSIWNPPAPSPTVALNMNGINAGRYTFSRERPGFFRRVFGSSRGHAHDSAERLQPALLPLSFETFTSDPITSRAAPASPVLSPPLVPELQSPSNHAASSANVYKKPSSFFRRRKRSASELAQAPIPPLNLKHIRAGDPLVPSPSISSLRKVMNPYLDSPRTLGHCKVDSSGDRTLTRPDGGDSAAGSHLGYALHKKASIPAIRHGSRGEASAPPPQRAHINALPSEMSSPLPESPNANVGIRPASPILAVQSGNGVSVTRDLGSRVGTLSAPPQSPAIDRSADTKRSDSSPAVAGITRPHPRLQRVNEAPPTRIPLGNENKWESGLNTPSRYDQCAREGYLYFGPSTITPPEDPFALSGPMQCTETPRAQRSAINRVWLQPTSSEKYSKWNDIEPALHAIKSHIVPGLNGNVASEELNATSGLPEGVRCSIDLQPATVSSQDLTELQPLDSGRERATKLFNGEGDFTSTSEAGIFFGDADEASRRTRQAYMQLFSWHDQDILAAMRGLCGKLVLKGETQQVDRVLDSFAQRWCECNPNHGFKSADVVHTICYSLLLLNTDLHVAHIEQRMTRNQFVRNTVPTIRRVAIDTELDGQDTVRAASTQVRAPIQWTLLGSLNPSLPAVKPNIPVRHSSLEPGGTQRRRSFLPPQRPDLEDVTPPDSIDALVSAPCDGGIGEWVNQIEVILRVFYNSIRNRALPLHGALPPGFQKQSLSNTLSVRASNVLRRSPSALSKAPSENISIRSGRGTAGRWTKPSRSRPRLLASSAQASSRSSFDDSSIFSPAGSSTRSKYSWGKTATSISLESLVSSFTHQEDHQHSVGFANALCHAIIREEEGMSPVDSDDSEHDTVRLEDETLELAGAPWAKEGIVKHKHHLESGERKAKDRNWNECFAVIERGWMRLFSFSAKSSSIRQKQRNRQASSGRSTVVGGGNWSENAEQLASIMLRQTIASALPSPGYSKSRPWVFALSLPTGAVHLFQVGTPEIVVEFVSTANYWSARLSKEPLVGGVSSVEYGWSEAIMNSAVAMQREREEIASSTSATSAGQMYHGHPPQPASSAPSVHSQRDLGRPSTQSSFGSGSWDYGSVRGPSNKLPADGVKINDWDPPQQSMMASTLSEKEQMWRLKDYVQTIEEELRAHQELRSLIAIAFSPRHPNAAKAVVNWEKKSAYLLREAVKYRTYIDSLIAAATAKERFRVEKCLLSEGGRGPELSTSRPETAEVPGTADGEVLEELRPYRSDERW